MKGQKANQVQDNEPRRQKNHMETEDSFPIYRIFRFADRQDFLMIILGGICSLAAGACLPISFYLLIQFDNSYLSSSKSQMQSKGYHNMLTIIYLGIAAFFCNWSATTLWIVTGERQSSQCKKTYYASLLYQNAQFFDCNEHSLINSKFTIDTDHFQRALGEKIGLCLQFLGNMVSALVISLYEGWLMALLMIACAVLVLLVSLATMSTIKQKESMFLKFYSQAGGRAEEAISSIKTVKQFNAQSFQLNLFEKLLAGNKTEKIYSIIKIALSIGLVNALVYIMYSFGFWYGGNCLKGTNVCFANQTGVTYTAENVHIISNLIILCLVQFTLLAPALKQVVFGNEAAQRIFKVIDSEPKILIRNKGIRLEKLEGNVEFRNVTFSYPKNKNRKILDGLSLNFDLHSSAIVGESGCGKSTIVQLLMRVYDPDEGEILIDGHNLREIDVIWLRSQIGYVGQEPVLFAGTIRENLLFANPQATEQQISSALRQAEVHSFIIGLQNGLDTYVGVGGGQVSGGQKQRIAIARALIKNPQLLILDEATSALDRTNQRLIQDTLNKISETLMTVTIAHRLSTITSSNTIFVIAKGKLEEYGKFSDLKYFQTKQQVLYQEEHEEPENNKEQVLATLNLGAQSSQSLIIDLPDFSDPKIIRRYSQLKKEKDEQLVSKYKNQMFWRIFSFNSNKKLLYALSIIINIGIGVLYPIFAIFASKVYVYILDFHTNTYNDPLSNIYLQSLYILLMGITAFVLYFLQSLCGETVGDEVSNNLRSHTYGKILKMPISWFDKRENTCGAISSRLSVECEKVKDLLTTYIYLIVRSFTTFISGVIIMFIYQWKFALIIFGFVTILIASSIAKSYFKTKLTKQLDLVSLKTNGIVEESLMNIRTVASFNMQEILITKYEKQLKGPSESLVRIGIVAGFMNGLGYIIIIMVFGILSYIAILMMVYDGANVGDIITAILQFYFMSITLSRNFGYLPDVEETSISIANIFSVLDAEDQEQIQDKVESKRLKNGFDGDIEIRNLCFKYEERNKNVLTNLNMKIKQGDKVAFVGASGCGKSTLFQLLLRFYQPTSGKIFVGGTPLQDFDIAYLRSLFGVVGQQPVVFNSSFRENICYNTPATEQQMREAAAKANATIFIQGKQRIEEDRDDDTITGFNRNVGARGFHISGGQKQRVAIARVLLRNPKILLLDEATSALDAQNEREVQHSLDCAMEGRTTVTVAHRIETIKNSNQIHVFSKGKVVESGIYQELVARRGMFWRIEMGNKK